MSAGTLNNYMATIILQKQWPVYVEMQEYKTNHSVRATFAIFKFSKLTCISSASLPASQPAIRPNCARCRLQKFHMIKVMAADLRKCCSEDDLPTRCESHF